MTNMTIEKVKIECVKTNPNNPRIIKDDKYKKLVKSIKDFPQMLEVRPIVVDDDMIVLGGNMRLKACLSAGLKEVSIIKFKDLSEEQKKEFIVKDNVGYGEWDWDMINKEWDVSELTEWGLDVPEFDSYTHDKSRAGALKNTFIVPPFSVLDTRTADWLDRKREWLNITGNLTESKEGVLGDGGLVANINGGSSNFDPVLAEVIYKWFNVDGGKVLDPFGGEQTKGVVCGELKYPYFGCEFRQEQVDVNKRYCDKYNSVNYYCGDSNNIDTIITERGFDICFTSPPYYDLEVYSKDDMSALGTYEEFMKMYKNIFSKCVSMLNDNRFVIVKVCEIRDKKTGEYRNFVGDNIKIFKELGLHYYNEIILLNAIGTLPFRAGKFMNSSRKIGKLHQNILVFYKGNIKEIGSNFPKIVSEDDKS